MKNTFILKTIALSAVFFLYSCNLDKDLKNPNEAESVNITNIDLVFNTVQVDFADFFATVSHGRTSFDAGTFNGLDKIMRMQAMSAGYTYGSAVLASSIDRVWYYAYSRCLANIVELQTLAKANNYYNHYGVSRAIEAYIYLTLVDMFNDVPRSEALKGASGNYNPVADKATDVYQYAIDALVDARANIGKEGSPALTRDNFANGSTAKWLAFVNTMELKAWNNISLISSRKAEADTKITELLASNLIDTESENFFYKYGTASAPAGSRHPIYEQYYQPAAGAAAGYIGNYYMYQLYNGNGVQDPRWRYYFFRQVGSILTAKIEYANSVGCSKGAPPAQYTDKKYFCTFDPGFYGRDHGDGSGTPPDSPAITCVGSYPYGGKSDVTATTFDGVIGTTVRGQGANGAGIEPIWMSFYTDFLKAEIAARKSDNVTAKASLNDGVSNSITQIRNFATSIGQALPTGLEPSTTRYLNEVNNKFDAATTKLDVIGIEFYKALWGNGLEAYNLYRRTGAPRDIAPLINQNPDAFYRTMPYPANFVNLNANVKQRNVTEKVFWDTNPSNLN